jgi:hypothetical protein
VSEFIEITPSEAERIAREAIEGIVDLTGGAVTVEAHDGCYVVTFGRNDPPGVRGPDFDAKVTLDRQTGEVLEILGAS